MRTIGHCALPRSGRFSHLNNVCFQHVMVSWDYITPKQLANKSIGEMVIKVDQTDTEFVELSEADGKTRMALVHMAVSEGTAGAGGWAQALGKRADLISVSTPEPKGI